MKSKTHPYLLVALLPNAQCYAYINMDQCDLVLIRETQVLQVSKKMIRGAAIFYVQTAAA